MGARLSEEIGSIYQTRSFSAPSAAAAPLAKGSRFGASVAAHGERLATARLQLEEKVADPSKVFNRPTVMRRYFPQLAAALQTKPPVDELTMSLTDDLAIVDVWAGSAELTIPEVRGEDMHSLAPSRIGKGYRLGMSYSVTDLRILKNYVGSARGRRAVSMPLYTITTQAGVLDGPAKANLADKLTAFHVEYAGVPKNWVHIVFHEYPSGSGFTAGKPSPQQRSRC